MRLRINWFFPTFFLFLGCNAQHDQGASHVTVFEEMKRLKRVLDPETEEFPGVYVQKAKRTVINWDEVVQIMVSHFIFFILY